MPPQQSSAWQPAEETAAVCRSSNPQLLPASPGSPSIIPAIPTASRPLLRCPDSQIRLLQVEPEGFDDTIRCTMSSHELELVPPFNAISYTWGDAQLQREILINGDSFSVRLNCHYAIQQARNFSPGVPVWIDSVCINQENMDEKNAQVQIMGDIYAKATLVLACIGPSDTASDFIMEFINDSNALEAAIEVEQAQQSMDRDDPEWSVLGTEASTISEHWKTFTARPYFERLWVLQELHEGRDRVSILCGRTSIKWNILCAAFIMLDIESPMLLLQSSDGFLALTEALASVGRHTTFGALLEKSADLLCADPRDRVYGVLRLIDWELWGLSKPTVDYTITRAQLAMDLVRKGYFDSIEDVSVLVLTLDLDWEDLASYHFSHRSLPATRSFKSFLWWTVCIVEQYPCGKLVAELVRNNTRENEAQPTPHDFKAMLGDKTPSEVYTGDCKSALLCPDVLGGDVIFSVDNLTMVLRPLGKGYYQVIGRAIFLDNFGIRERGMRQCGCQAVFEQDGGCVTMQLSPEDAVKMAVLSQFGSYSEPSRRQRERAKRNLAANLPSPGSILYDESVAWMAEEKLCPVLKKNCVAHKVEDIQWDHEHGSLWNAAIASCDGLIEDQAGHEIEIDTVPFKSQQP